MTIVATEIVRDFRTGSSLPALVRGSDDVLYVVKWNGTAEGIISNVTDGIASNLASLIGIQVPKSRLIKIERTLCRDPMDPELKDLALRSIGTNLAIEYLPNAIPYQEPLRKRIDENLRNKIFLFDLLVLNIDRVENNPNMLFNNSALFCIDFSAALAIRQLLIQQTISESALLSLLRRHPFYSENITVTKNTFTIRYDLVREVIANLPKEWLFGFGYDSARAREQLSAGIFNIFRNAETILQQRLPDLMQTHFQSNAERLELRLKNRNSFKMRFGL